MLIWHVSLLPLEAERLVEWAGQPELMAHKSKCQLNLCHDHLKPCSPEPGRIHATSLRDHNLIRSQ